MKDLESSKVRFLEYIYFEFRSPRKAFNELRCIIHELIIFSTESFVDDGSEA